MSGCCKSPSPLDLTDCLHLSASVCLPLPPSLTCLSSSVCVVAHIWLVVQVASERYRSRSSVSLCLLAPLSSSLFPSGRRNLFLVLLPLPRPLHHHHHYHLWPSVQVIVWPPCLGHDATSVMSPCEVVEGFHGYQNVFSVCLYVWVWEGVPMTHSYIQFVFALRVLWSLRGSA